MSHWQQARHVPYSAVFSALGRQAIMALAVFVAATGSCMAEHAPEIEITGSYFPIWMLYLVVGILASVVCRAVLIRVGIDDYMPFRVVSYAALALAFTFALLLFGWRLP